MGENLLIIYIFFMYIFSLTDFFTKIKKFIDIFGSHATELSKNSNAGKALLIK